MIGKLLSNVAYYWLIESNSSALALVWFILKPTTIWNVKTGRRFSGI
jgi:hypothetical protein